MANAGIKSQDLPPQSLIDSLVGNRDGSTGLISLQALAAQLLSAGPLAGRLASIDSISSFSTNASFGYVGSGAAVELEVGTIVVAVDTGFEYTVLAAAAVKYEHINQNNVRLDPVPRDGFVLPEMWGNDAAAFESAGTFATAKGLGLLVQKDFELDAPVTVDCENKALLMVFRNGATVSPVADMTPQEHLLKFENAGDVIITGVGEVHGLELVAIALFIENFALADKLLIDRHITVRGGRRRVGMNNEGTSLRLAGGWYKARIQGGVIALASYDVGAGIESVKGCACLTVAHSGTNGEHYIRSLHIEAVFGAQADGGDLIDSDVVKVLSPNTHVYISRLEIGGHTGRAVKLQSASTTIDYVLIERSGAVQDNYTGVDQQLGDSLVVHRAHIKYLDGAVPGVNEKLFHITVRPGVGRAEMVLENVTVDLTGIDSAATYPADRILALCSMGHEDPAGTDRGILRLRNISTKNGLMRRLVHLNLSSGVVDEVHIDGARIDALSSQLIYINNGEPWLLSGRLQDVRHYGGASVPVVTWGTARSEKPTMSGRDLVGFNDPLSVASTTEFHPVESVRKWRNSYDEGAFHLAGSFSFSDGEYHDVTAGSYWAGALKLNINSHSYPSSGTVQVRDGTTATKISGEASLYTGAPAGGDPAGIYVEAITGGARIHCHDTGGSRHVSYTT